MGYFSILSTGIYLVCQCRMTVGELMACQVLFLSFNEALSRRVKLGHQQDQIEADLQSIDDIMHSPKESSGLQSLSKKERCLGKIQIIDLTFGYNREFKPLFSHFDLTIEPGSQVAITGPSGSGKSTLIQLLSGLYQPWSGTILIDGVPLHEYSPIERARRIGVVSQQQFFYQGSIKDNLCLWGEACSDEDIMAALRMACIDDLVTNTEDGLDFQLSEGATNISGGQRQRLEIARTLLVRPQLLLLDEATSSLDLLVEEQIKINLNQYPATKIVVAHRQNTIQGADKIYILNKGQLIENAALKKDSLALQESNG